MDRGARHASAATTFTGVAVACAVVGAAFRVDTRTGHPAALEVAPVQDHEGHRNSTAHASGASSGGQATFPQAGHLRGDGLPENLLDVWPAAWSSAFKPEVELASSALTQVVDARIVSDDRNNEIHVAVKVRVGDTIKDAATSMNVGNPLSGWYMDNEERAMRLFKGPPFLTLYHWSRYYFRDAGSGHRRQVMIMAMELATGPSMESALVEESDTGILLRLFLELLLGIKTMFEFGHLHRGIKPENIIVVGDCANGGRCHIRIIDYAGACSLGPDGPWFPHPCNSVYAGTLAYLPPEVIVPLPVPHSVWSSGTSDVWSAGIILYRILCGGLYPAVVEPLAHELETAGLNLSQHVLNIKEDARFNNLKQDAHLSLWAPLLEEMLERDPRRRLNPVAAFRTAQRLLKDMGLSWGLDTPPPPLPSRFNLPIVEPDDVVRS